MVFLPAGGVVWYEVELSRQAGVRMASESCRLACSQSSQSIQSPVLRKSVCKRVSPSLHSVGLTCAMCGWQLSLVS